MMPYGITNFQLILIFSYASIHTAHICVIFFCKSINFLKESTRLDFSVSTFFGKYLEKIFRFVINGPSVQIFIKKIRKKMARGNNGLIECLPWHDFESCHLIYTETVSQLSSQIDIMHICILAFFLIRKCSRQVQ